MKEVKEIKSFLESIKDSDPELISSINEAVDAIFEARAYVDSEEIDPEKVRMGSDKVLEFYFANFDNIGSDFGENLDGYDSNDFGDTIRLASEALLNFSRFEDIDQVLTDFGRRGGYYTEAERRNIAQVVINEANRILMNMFKLPSRLLND